MRGGDSPITRPRRLLPESVITALKRARNGVLISGDRQMVTLKPDDATTLTGWLCSIADQPGMVDADRAKFREAADTIERAP